MRRRAGVMFVFFALLTFLLLGPLFVMFASRSWARLQPCGAYGEARRWSQPVRDFGRHAMPDRSTDRPVKRCWGG